ncbi:MAG: redoxin domain-containing protein [Anaerolineales bacterium]|nr:redoxin domain-containing protein [Anaerolineales bacterium]
MTNRVELSTPAPDFELSGFDGTAIRLSDFRGKQPVVLVFNRGFQ